MTKAAKDKKVPKRVQAIIDACSRGQSLVVFHLHKASGDTEQIFRLEPSGKVVGPKGAAQAISDGHLKPRCDGLFGPDTSQTWGA